MDDVETITEALSGDKLLWLYSRGSCSCCDHKWTRVCDQPPEGHASVREADAWLKRAADTHEIWGHPAARYLLVRAVRSTVVMWPD